MSATPEAVQAAVTAPPVATTDEAREKELSLDNLKRDYIGPMELADRGQSAVTRAIEIAQHHGLPVEFTFEQDKELPFGYGVAIVPVTKQSEMKGEKSKKVGLIVAQIPDPDLLTALDPNPEEGAEAQPLHPNGRKFLRDIAISRFQSSVAASKKRAEDSGDPVAFPTSVEDFISGRSGESLEAWRTLCEAFVRRLRKKKFKRMTQPLLKQILTSSAMAEQLHGGFPQTIWEQILDGMIAAAKQKGIDPGALQTWRDTRNSVVIVDPDELDVEDLLAGITEDLASADSVES